MYGMLCTRTDIYYAMGIVSRYQSNLRPNHWVVVKHILKYLKRTKDYMIVYSDEGLMPFWYMNSNFQSDKDEDLLPLCGDAIVWRVSRKLVC